jgi:putative transposase
VRIVPIGTKYKVEIVYEKEEKNLKLNKYNVLAIDLGLNNIVTGVNNIGLRPIIVKGGVVKSINQYFNKQLAKYKSIAKKVNGLEETKRTRRLYQTRNNKIIAIFHRISKNLISYCIENDIGTIVIGHNNGWKQGIDIGKRNNQNFVQVPFSKLIQQLEYKSKIVGIEMVIVDESYTSKCSFLNNEEVKKHSKYKGKRISRGLFRSSNGTIINADVNAGYNIMKKVFPNAISVDGIEVFGLTPQIMSRNLYDVVI